MINAVKRGKSNLSKKERFLLERRKQDGYNKLIMSARENLFTLLVLSCNQLNHLSYSSQLMNLQNYSFTWQMPESVWRNLWKKMIWNHFFNYWQDCPGWSVAVTSDRNRPVSQTAVYIQTLHNLSTHQKLDLRSWHFGDISVIEYIEKDFWDALHCCPGSKWILIYSTKWQLGSKLQ